jgi:hypothetical protein
MRYGKRSWKGKPECLTRIPEKSFEVVGTYGVLPVAQQRPFCQNTSLHRLSLTINQVGRTSPSYSRTVSPGPACYRPGGLGS